MARRDKPANHGPAVREHLLRLNMAVACTLIGVRWMDGKGCLLDQLASPTQPPLPALTPEQLDSSPFGGIVRVLAAGEAHRCRRSELPDWCPEHFAGDPYDEFELGGDNVLRPLIDG